MKIQNALWIVLLFFTGLLMDQHEANAQPGKSWKYPETRKVEQVDEYFERQVKDPYRWLENDVRVDKNVETWVSRQNRLTFGYLKQLPYREEIEKRITRLWNYEKYGLPRKAGEHYYYAKNDGLQNQSVIYQVDSLDGDPSVLVDPNQWS